MHSRKRLASVLETAETPVPSKKFCFVKTLKKLKDRADITSHPTCGLVLDDTAPAELTAVPERPAEAPPPGCFNVKHTARDCHVDPTDQLCVEPRSTTAARLALFTPGAGSAPEVGTLVESQRAAQRIIRFTGYAPTEDGGRVGGWEMYEGDGHGCCEAADVLDEYRRSGTEESSRHVSDDRSSNFSDGSDDDKDDTDDESNKTSTVKRAAKRVRFNDDIRCKIVSRYIGKLLSIADDEADTCGDEDEGSSDSDEDSSEDDDGNETPVEIPDYGWDVDEGGDCYEPDLDGEEDSSSDDSSSDDSDSSDDDTDDGDDTADKTAAANDRSKKKVHFSDNVQCKIVSRYIGTPLMITDDESKARSDENKHSCDTDKARNDDSDDCKALKIPDYGQGLGEGGNLKEPPATNSDDDSSSDDSSSEDSDSSSDDSSSEDSDSSDAAAAAADDDESDKIPTSNKRAVKKVRFSDNVRCKIVSRYIGTPWIITDDASNESSDKAEQMGNVGDVYGTPLKISDCGQELDEGGNPHESDTCSDDDSSSNDSSSDDSDSSGDDSSSDDPDSSDDDTGDDNNEADEIPASKRATNRVRFSDNVQCKIVSRYIGTPWVITDDASDARNDKNEDIGRRR